MKLRFLGAYRNAALLVVRIGLGLSFVLHGYPKMFGGPEYWERLGGAMQTIGVDFLPTFWGFMAAFAEFGGGILMILGFYFRPAMVLLTVTMGIAVLTHLERGDGFKDYSHALELGVVFLCLLFVGPGRLSIDGD